MILLFDMNQDSLAKTAGFYTKITKRVIFRKILSKCCKIV
jgi:hypothetical protein